MKKIIIATLLITLFWLASCNENKEHWMMKHNIVDNNVTKEDIITSSEDSSNLIKKEVSTKKEDSIIMNSNFKMNYAIWKEILLDDKGMTLYVFKNDTKNVSNCSGECEVKWPVYYNESLIDNGFSSIKRADWKMQTTYNGYPLYYFFKDIKAGDINGQKVKNVWFVVDKEVSFFNDVMDDKIEK